MKKVSNTLLIILFAFGCTMYSADINMVTVSKNGRYFEYKGKPFVYLGDKAWELFHKLDREEATEYLKNDGSFVMAYMAVGQPVSIVMKKISGDKVNASWYNPRKGQSTFIGEFKNEGIRTFIPPTSGLNNDWVLVLDDNVRYPTLQSWRQ